MIIMCIDSLNNLAVSKPVAYQMKDLDWISNLDLFRLQWKNIGFVCDKFPKYT